MLYMERQERAERRSKAKRDVLHEIANGQTIERWGGGKYRIGAKHIVHIRFASNRATNGYPFNINSRTLTADFELWICGDASCWYLLPMHEINSVYHDPDHYPDRHDYTRHIVNINPDDHLLAYATGGQKLDCAEYHQATLPIIRTCGCGRPATRFVYEADYTVVERRRTVYRLNSHGDLSDPPEEDSSVVPSSTEETDQSAPMNEQRRYLCPDCFRKL